MSQQNQNAARFADNTLMQSAGVPEQMFPTSALYIVGLPIGNAADITLRSLWILDLCDLIACEDTRETRKLLDRYGIHTPTVSVREHNERSATESLLDKLSAGARIALVTDAGTPAVSDPGAKAVDVVRQAGFQVIPVPGACAAVTAMSASGLDSYTFTFVGFVPPTAKARKELLATYASRNDAFILYEAPHRLKELLKDLAAALDADRRVVVARELTKRFETFEAMLAQDLPEWVEKHEARGEYVIVVDMHQGKNEGLDESAMKWARELVKELPLSRAAAVTAKVTGIKRDAVYRLLSELER
ncbi:MAG: 16S rRNA (cytidine(1402)-2'-O)-methyltransferase [Sutterellaceae bacterium]|nr:16S rRNA (cytidine(1402)-2'-O)-methyltransferase [Sutterellaceae bacterium]